ncbi:MAG: hypothetical protein HW394_1359 [Acidobacteria bacterium]|nr:hypothetical protein [Acidobacteriota bacterium]
MMHRGLATIVTLVTVVTAGASRAPAQIVPEAPSRPRTMAGCPTDNLAFHTCALQKAKAFTPPRLPNGRPNFEGYWRGRLVQAFSVEGVPADDPLIKDPIMPWTAAPPEVVEPADRRIPYQPWAAAIGRRGVNFKDYIDPRTTCSTAGVPRLALQDASQILQPPTEDHVLWLHDDHHQFRVIAMGQRPAVGRDVTAWNGLSRGRWDGNTLVIETANFNGFTWIDDAGNFYTDNARLTERLTMIDPDTIHYEVTVEDPTVYTRPWRLAWALIREKEPGFELIEEACREGERALGRIREQGYKFYFGESWRGR